MKILFNDNSLREFLNFRGTIAQSYRRNEYEVILISPVNIEIPQEYSWIKLYPVKLNRSGMNPITDFVLFLRYLCIYFKEKPDYIFHYTIKPNIYGSIAAKLLNIPSTAMITGLGYVFHNKGLVNKFARWLYIISMKCSSSIFVLNASIRDFIIKQRIVEEQRIIFLEGGEGVDLTKFRNTND